MSHPKKALPLCILRVLQEHTDADHRLLQADIQRLLLEEYGLDCERKAVARNVALLQQLGYDVSHTGEGYALLAREFDPTQTRLLMDAVLTSSYISERDARELLHSLAAGQSRHFRQKHGHLEWVRHFPHTRNPQMFYNIEVILEAIDLGRKVAFTYSHLGSDKKPHPVRAEKYEKSPYNILLKKGEYYLLCDLVEEDGVDHFRLEFISDIEILDQTAEPGNVDIHAYYNEHIYMMRGRSVDAVLKVETWIIEQMFDWLGFDIQLERHDERYTIVRTRANFQSLLYFALQYILSVEVLQPQEVRDFLCEFLEVGQAKYTQPAGAYQSDMHTKVDRRIRQKRSRE